MMITGHEEKKLGKWYLITLIMVYNEFKSRYIIKINLKLNDKRNIKITILRVVTWLYKKLSCKHIIKKNKLQESLSF